MKLMQEDAEAAQVSQLQNMKGERLAAQQGQKQAEAKSAAAVAELAT